VTAALTSTDRARLDECLHRAIAALKAVQHGDGHWCGELEGDSILESEYLLMKFILGQEDEPLADGRPASEALPRIANCLRRQQREDGGWGQFPGSGVDLSATVKAYFALKLMGDDPDAPHMRAARGCILQHGGAERCNSFTMFYLACLGQVPWGAVPAIPPEIVFLPHWFYFHLTKVSAWTRTMILPLSLVVTLRPTRRLPRVRGIDELFVDPRERRRLTLRHDTPAGWRVLFRAIDHGLKLLHRLGGTPVRRFAIRKAERWILQRAGQEGAGCTDGLGAIFPPMVYLQIAFQALGYRRDHAVIARAERELDAFFIEEPESDEIRIQPCFSPVWDTGIALYALTDCGLTVDDDSVRRAADWLVSKECRQIGDWIANLRPGAARRAREAAHAGGDFGFGWYFEYHNAWYPDCDDTAMVAMALARAGDERALAAAKRGAEWLFAMQNEDGGWAAFDRTRNRPILEHIPFADHNAVQDPSCPDITGRVLECLRWHGYDNKHPAVRRAIDYIKSHQLMWEGAAADRSSPRLGSAASIGELTAHDRALPRSGALGCWFGRWGVNYIYGTWQAVIGPIRCGEDPSQEWIQRAGRWIKSIQKPDGSFGESAMSYEDPELKGQGPSTASQTAWAAMIIQEIYGPADPDLRRAIDWLVTTQLGEEQAADPLFNPDGDLPGGWVETQFTGTGFPRVFYLRYHLYRLYFPIMAIGRYLAAQNSRVGAHVEPTAALREQPIEVKVFPAAGAASRRMLD
jgi:squalene-hopene/tetraprenyl-beta-curcumene cyclase